MAEKQELLARVKGRVQGVGYRAFVERLAAQLGLTGYVKNRHDGSVEVLAQGQRAALNRLIERLREGPPVAWVSDVEVEWRPLTEDFDRFGVAF